MPFAGRPRVTVQLPAVPDYSERKDRDIDIKTDFDRRDFARAMRNGFTFRTRRSCYHLMRAVCDSGCRGHVRRSGREPRVLFNHK